MAYEVWWALVLGFAISGVVQAWVPRARIESALAGSGFVPIAKATGLGAASSSCSYAAIAIAKSLFQKGASAATALAFQFASTNLVWELGLVLWVLIGWQFALAEYVGGFILIGLMTLLLRRFVSPRLEAEAREHARAAQEGHVHDHGSSAAPATGWRARVASRQAWAEVAANFRGDWTMLWKEIGLGFLLAGFIALLGDDFFNVLFVTDAPRPVRTIENVVAGPLIAILSFVCSVGNVPLAAVLWSGGISFAGVVAFIFADLVVLPIVLALPQVLRHRLRPADHRPDAGHDRPRGACRRRPLQPRRDRPRRAPPQPRRRLRLDLPRLQARPQPDRHRDLRRPLVAEPRTRGFADLRAPRRLHLRVRDE